MNKGKKILLVRSLKGFPDSRVEKEVFSLSQEYGISVFGWDRYDDYGNYKKTYIDIFGRKIAYWHVGIKAPIGEGFSKLFFPLLKFWQKEYKFLKERRRDYDVIHACDFDTALVACFAAKRFNKKFIYDIFDYYSQSHSGPGYIMKIIKKVDNWLISKSDATIICSELRKEQIKGANPNQLVVIHNSPREEKMSISQRMITASSKRMKLVYIGLLSNDRFLKHMSNVIKKRKDVEWHVGGWGGMEKYFIEESRISENIFFYGQVPYRAVLGLEKECDIMTAIYDPVLPNHKYAAPNKFYEALLIKKPIIMIKNTGMDKYVSDYNIGEVIDLEGCSFEDAFSKALDAILAKRDIWAQMGERAYGLYKKEFSWKEMEIRLLNLYEIL